MDTATPTTADTEFDFFPFGDGDQPKPSSGRKSEDAKIAEEDNRRVLRSKRPSRAKVR